MTSLKIVLSGYGRMGKEIEKTALSRHHSILCRIDNELDWEKESEHIKTADAVIDFSAPSVAVSNINRCFDRNLPVVVGTTGWENFRESVEERCRKENQSLFVSSNFSIGVHIFLATARFLASKMDAQPRYKVLIEETHHIHKLDKPSGTAISLAREVISELERYTDWKPVEKKTDTYPPHTLPIESFREGETVGIHNLEFESEMDRIGLRHQAKSRQGFALGAVCAAEWLVGRKGSFSMKDMLGF